MVLILEKYAMKFVVLSVLLASVAMTANAEVYDAPAMRGELPHLSPPSAQNLSLSPIAGVPTPVASVGEMTGVPTLLIDATTVAGGKKIDVTLMDEFIADISPNARHYPPLFPNATAEYNAYSNVKHLVNWLKPYADAPTASFEVLLRMAKLTIMGRNMGVSEYALPASTYLTKALKMHPNHAETNFLYGMMLSEGGGIKEGKRYLDKAAAQGYLEAEQSLIQSELIGGTGDRTKALARLKALHAKHPNNEQIAKQVAIVEAGGYYIWQIEDNDLSIKPVQ